MFSSSVKSILKVPRQMIPCPTSWLPVEDSHLVGLLEEPVCEATSSIGKKVWFPEDADGEPNIKNPDDGCGGGKYKNNNIFYIYATIDGRKPNEDMSNVLEGSLAFQSLRNEKRCKNFHQTANYFRELMDNIRCFGKNPNFWKSFQSKVDKLDEPDWAYIGLAWKIMYGIAKRPEELDF